MLPEEGVNAVRVVVALLVRGDYEELETLTEGRRLSASDMAAALAGHDLLSPPEEGLRRAGGDRRRAGLRPASAPSTWPSRCGRRGTAAPR
ncbi:hypothetical protein [Actinomadura madurae]|uniref:hypothetical protein n=1 Tax=Actinomadura madurae TaxID=1993 RepID=UPI0020D24AE5|nr:hypothetical protein [Actinomadura madurae]MCQ0021365.1 hypothetical protein [Actinomadura madurae]